MGFRNVNGSNSHEDRHKAPARPPASPQTGAFPMFTIGVDGDDGRRKRPLLPSSSTPAPTEWGRLSGLCSLSAGCCEADSLVIALCGFFAALRMTILEAVR